MIKRFKKEASKFLTLIAADWVIFKRKWKGNVLVLENHYDSYLKKGDFTLKKEVHFKGKKKLK